MGYEEQKIEGRNAVLEAFRSGKTIDKLFVFQIVRLISFLLIQQSVRKLNLILCII